MQLSKAYSHKDIESKWYSHWLNAGLFAPAKGTAAVFFDCDSAAERYRFAAHGARTQ